MKLKKNKKNENSCELMQVVEGILFVYGDEGISLADLSTVLDQEKPSQIAKVLDSLKEKYLKDSSCAFSLQKFNPNKYRLQTKPELYSYLAKLEDIKSQNKLSPSTIEVLSIIAYQGPIVKAEIDKIRGTDCSYQVMKLRENNLIRITGKKPDTHANIYEITDNFFKIFNLDHGLDSLPQISEAEIQAEKAEINLKNQQVKTNENKDIFFNPNDDWSEGN